MNMSICATTHKSLAKFCWSCSAGYINSLWHSYTLDIWIFACSWNSCRGVVFICILFCSTKQEQDSEGNHKNSFKVRECCTLTGVICIMSWFLIAFLPHTKGTLNLQITKTTPIQNYVRVGAGSDLLHGFISFMLCVITIPFIRT